MTRDEWLSAGTHTTFPGPVEVMSTTPEVFAPGFRAAYEALSHTAA